MVAKNEDMRIGTVSPWLGCKRYLSSEVIAELGPHKGFWDVTAGGLPILLAKPPCLNETINDLHGDVINLTRVVKDQFWGPRLYRRLEATLCDESLFDESQAVIAVADQQYDEPDEEAAERAYHYFVSSWMGRNGMAGTKLARNSFAVRYTPRGGSPAVRFASAVDSMPAWHRRLRRVTILRRDLFELLPKIPDDKAVAVYVDPPYIEEGGRYRHSFGPEDHERLAIALSLFKDTRVVVSYYEHDLLLELYKGWTIRSVARNKQLSTQGSRTTGSERAPEVLILNGPSYVEAA